MENFLEIPFGRCIADRPLFHGSKRLIPSGKRLQFANLKISHRNFVDLPINSMVDLSSSFFVCFFQRITGDGYSHGWEILPLVRSFSQGFRPCLTTLEGNSHGGPHIYSHVIPSEKIEKVFPG